MPGIMNTSLQIIQIGPANHKLEGIENFEYIYDRQSKTLVINADGVELRSYNGTKATSIFLKMIE